LPWSEEVGVGVDAGHFGMVGESLEVREVVPPT
jgi:hypothetical protein